MDVTASLQRLQLQPDTQPYCHMLFLEYPATSLIPSSPTGRFSLRLQQPKDAAYREMPDLGKYSLQERGLDYFIRYDVTLRWPQGFPQPNFTDHPSAINQLSTCGGRSVLEAVTVSDNKLGEDSYIFRLTTLWHPSGAHQVHNFPFSKKDWKYLTTSPVSKAWTSLFQDLFSRASDRAYFHVKRQLHPTEYLSIGAQKWDSYRIATANELLALNMRRVKVQDGMLCLEPVRDLWGERTGGFTVRLPCEHETTTSIRFLKSLSKAECIDLVCGRCGRNVMQESDIRQAELGLERRRRQRASVDEILWKRLVAQNPDTVTHMAIPGQALCYALCHALRSMQVPESVTPRALCPAWSSEASAALHKIIATYDGNPLWIEGTVEEIYHLLMELVDAAVQELMFSRTGYSVSCGLMPGWMGFCCG